MKKKREKNHVLNKNVPTPWDPSTFFGFANFENVSDPVGILRDFPVRFWRKKRYRPLGIPIHFLVSFPKFCFRSRWNHSVNRDSLFEKFVFDRVGILRYLRVHFSESKRCQPLGILMLFPDRRKREFLSDPVGILRYLRVHFSAGKHTNPLGSLRFFEIRLFFCVFDPVGILRDFLIHFSKSKLYQPLGIPIHFLDQS